MLAIPFVLRQASMPIQYPCEASLPVKATSDQCVIPTKHDNRLQGLPKGQCLPDTGCALVRA